MKVYFLFFLLLLGCTTPRSNVVLGIDYPSQPARVAMRWECNGKQFTTQGTGVCEQRGPTQAKVSVKIPPIEGQVIYSNGQLKATEDFNWYPKEGFWLWKKKPIKDTWAELNLGEIASTYGDWPVAIDVAALHKDVGLIVTRGMLYHRVCDDLTVACSKLVVKFECSGVQKATGLNELGKCERMSGSAHPFRVQLEGPGYKALPGAKIYISAPRLGMAWFSITPDTSAFTAGEMKLEIPQVLNGPTLVGFRLAWIEKGEMKQVETRVLVIGFSPEWTGLDQPHWREDQGGIQFVKPVRSDVLEANLYEGRELKKKLFSGDKITSFPKPQGSQVACAFAWQRDSSDQTVLCLDAELKEVHIP